MSVLHVLEAIEGGVARHLVNLVGHVDADHIVVIPSERVGGLTDNAAIAAIASAGATVEQIDMRRSPTSPRTLAAVPKVNRLINRVKPAVVHGHSAIGGVVARLGAVGTSSARVYTPHGLYPALSACAIGFCRNWSGSRVKCSVNVLAGRHGWNSKWMP